jgi:hypothetical protein
MSKRKDQSAEQPAPSNHSPEQVKEVALMLYARQQFPLDSPESKRKLELLVWRALDVLDTLNEVCEKVASERQAAKETGGLDPQSDVPFKTAVKFITRENRLERALDKIFPIACFYSFDEASASRMIADRRKNGINRANMMDMRRLYDEMGKRLRIATAGSAKKRRKKWPRKRRIKVANALLKTVQPGEIE